MKLIKVAKLKDGGVDAARSANVVVNRTSSLGASRCYLAKIKKAWELLNVLEFPPMGTPFPAGLFSSEEGANFLTDIPSYGRVCEAFLGKVSHLANLEPGAAKGGSFSLDTVAFGMMSLVAMADPWDFSAFNGLDMLRPAMLLPFVDPLSPKVVAVEKLMRFDIEALSEGLKRLDGNDYPGKDDWLETLACSADGGFLRLVEGRAEFSSAVYFEARHFMSEKEFLDPWIARALSLEKVKAAMDVVGDRHALNAWVTDPLLGWNHLIMWLCDGRGVPLLGCSRGWDSRFPSAVDLAGCTLVGKVA